MNHEFDSNDYQSEFSLDFDGAFGPADELASTWFDRDLFDHGAFDGDDAEATISTGTENLRRFADLAFLHALLENVHKRAPRTTEERIARVMQRIADDPAEIAAIRPAEQVAGWWSVSRWALPYLSAAAALIAMLTWYWAASPTRSAYAAVQRAYLDAARAKDRQYRVTTDVRISTNHTMSMESLLTVRGSQQFTLRHPVLLGQAWIGSNGHEAWMVPAVGQRHTKAQPTMALEWIHKQGLNLPDPHISSLINFLANQFDLDLLPSEPLPDAGNVLWQRVRGVRREVQADRPQLVELWSHPKTGVARKLVFEWQRHSDQLGVARITFDLLSEDPMPDSWYEADSHQPLPILPIPPIVPIAQP